MIVKLNDLIAFLDEKKITYKKWYFLSGNVASVAIKGRTVWERIERESHGIILCSKLETAIINYRAGVEFKTVVVTTKSGKVQNRLFWSYDGVDWCWIGKKKPTLLTRHYKPLNNKQGK